MKVTFTYVRHGKTLFNQLGRIQGMCDSPLLEEGIEGAKNTASALCRVNFSRCYCSSSKRAWDTAEILCRSHHLKPILSRDLREFDFGSLDGEYMKDVRMNSNDEFVKEDWSEYHGDSMASFTKRSERIFQEMLSSSKDGDNVLVVGHGAYIMHLMETMLHFDRASYIRKCNEEKRPWMPNCGICIFSWQDGVWKMEQTPLSADEYRMKYNRKKIRFTYVRHGETQFNLAGRMQGRCDSPLTQNGIRQAEEAHAELKDTAFDRVYVSPLERTRDTAEILLKGRNVPEFFDERLMEVSFGSLEAEKVSFTSEDIMNRSDEVRFGELGGEDLEDVRKRLTAFFNEVTDQAEDGDSILLVSHGMLYFMVLKLLFHVNLGEMFRACAQNGINPAPNCGICQFVYEGGIFRLIQKMGE